MLLCLFSSVWLDIESSSDIPTIDPDPSSSANISGTIRVETSAAGVGGAVLVSVEQHEKSQT